MPTTAKKKIFISDIHLGDARSMGKTTSYPYPYPYVWFKDNIGILSKFLDEQAKSDVDQVVILGDLFDRWIIPTDEVPLTDFQAIYNNPDNEPVITALKKLAENHKLTYVPGNHDMIFSNTAQEQAGIQQFLKDFPEINYIVEPDPTHGCYKKGTIVGEHGNYYTIFNAPEARMDQPSFLPLGYFISRLQGYKLAQIGETEDYHHILRRVVLKTIGDEDNFIKNFYESWAHDAQLEPTAHIEMNGIAGFPDTVEAIGNLYVELIKQWKEKRKDIDWHTAVAGEIGQLLLAAAVVHFSPSGSDTNIVIFGHTHKAEMWKNYELPIQGLNNILIRLIQQIDTFWHKLFEALPIPKLEIPKILIKAPMVKHFHLDLPCRSIYVNSGTWVDSAPYCTYVETQEDFEKGRHYVRLWTYPSKKYPNRKLLQEEYVNLKQ
jgi:UDP-2,3-diacylglucosamine pyrophosphatase LpxH